MPVNLPPGLQEAADAAGKKASKAASASLHILAAALTKGSEMRQEKDWGLLQYANEGVFL